MTLAFDVLERREVKGGGSECGRVGGSERREENNVVGDEMKGHSLTDQLQTFPWRD